MFNLEHVIYSAKRALVLAFLARIFTYLFENNIGFSEVFLTQNGGRHTLIMLFFRFIGHMILYKKL